MNNRHMEIEENDRNYRHYIANLRSRLCTSTSRNSVHFAHSAPALDEVTKPKVLSPLSASNHSSWDTANDVSPTSEALAVTSQVPLLTPRESEEFLDKCGGIAEYDGQSLCSDAQARTELESRQCVTKLAPGSSKSRLHMLSTNGTVTHDPAKCYLWTREELGFGWWYASQFPPPQW